MEKRKKSIKNFFAEFKKFIQRGNVLDMAVGVIVGSSFTAIVNGLSNYILKPLVNWLIALLIGKDGLEGAITMLSPAYFPDQPGVVDLANSIYIDWGSLISVIVNFLLIAFVLFSIVKIMNNLAEAREKFAQTQEKEFSVRKELWLIRKELHLSKQEARAVLEQRRAERAAKAAAEKAAAEELAAAQAQAEQEKAERNVRLLEEIRDLLKANCAK